MDLEGGVIFHTAVSIAGVGPTSSNKVEIEESIPTLSRAGVRVHLGKGALGAASVRALKRYGSVFAITPPASALFESRTVSRKVAAYKKEGMEALWELGGQRSARHNRHRPWPNHIRPQSEMNHEP